MIYVVKIIDRNAFNAVIAERAFNVPSYGRRWGEAQTQAIIAGLREDGDDLLDIEWTMTDYDNVDVTTVSPHKYIRR